MTTEEFANPQISVSRQTQIITARKATTMRNFLSPLFIIALFGFANLAIAAEGAAEKHDTAAAAHEEAAMHHKAAAEKHRAGAHAEAKQHAKEAEKASANAHEKSKEAAKESHKP